MNDQAQALVDRLYEEGHLIRQEAMAARMIVQDAFLQAEQTVKTHMTSCILGCSVLAFVAGLVTGLLI